MDSCNAQTPEEDIAIARQALAEGDPKHAMHHLAGALAVEPNHPEWLALLDETLEAGDLDLDLAPIDGEQPPYFGTVALHAYLLVRRGNLTRGTDILMQIIQGFPQIPYIEWLLAWMDRPEARDRLSMQRVGWFLSKMVQQYPGLKDQHEGARQTLNRLPDFIRKVRATQPADSDVLSVSVSILRRLGLLDEALEYAKAAYALQPSYRSAVAIAVAHESRQEPDAALEAYRDAKRFDPGDVAVRLSMADLLWQYDRLEEAEAMYVEALTLEANQPWALPSKLYLEWYRTGSEAIRFKLLALADACPENDRARQMAELATPYVGYLTEPSDATTNTFRKMLEEKGTTTGITKLSVSCLEAPSNYLAFPHLYQTTVSVAGLHQPDPRVPRREVAHVLWRYEGNRPGVAVAMPSPAVTQAVEQLARTHYSLKAWARQARRIAAELGVASVPDLLAVMVHPPMPEGIRRPWGWVYRVQMAAGLILAQTESAWLGSVRRAALHSLIWGPLDWTVDVALVALATIAQDEEETAEDITATFREFRAELPQGGALCYYAPLLWSMLRLPNLEPGERTEIRKSLRSWYEVEEDEAEVQYKVAVLHEKDQEDEAALKAVNRALSLRPDYADALELRGRLHLWAGRLREAVSDFVQTLEIEPGFTRAMIYRGEAFRQMRRYAEALGDLDEAIRREPKISFARLVRGQVHARMGNTQKAIEDFTQGIRIRPTALLHNERAACYYSQGDHARAIADHAEAVRISPNDAASCNGLAWILATSPQAELRDGLRAVELATRACEQTEWKWAGYLDTLAAACAEAGRFEEAVRHAERVLELVKPEHSEPYRQRLELYRKGVAFRTES